MIKNSANSFTLFISPFISLVIPLVLAACGSGGVNNDNSTLIINSANVPALQTLQGEVDAFLIVGDKTCALSLNEDTTLKGNCEIFSLGTHDYRVEYRHSVSDLILAQASGQLSFSKGKTTEIDMNNLSTDFNADNDEYSNLQEVVYHSDPEDENSIPPTIESIHLDKTIEPMETGQAHQISWSAIDPTVGQIVASSLAWTSSDESIVSINNQGLITVLKEGQVTITATDPFTDTTDSIEFFAVLPGFVNISPIADAGLDKMKGIGDVVTLSAEDSIDEDGTIKQYSWQCDNEKVVIVNPNAIEANFKAPPVDETQDFTLTLTVTDNYGARDSDTVVITVQPDNETPTADAGVDQKSPVNTLITLDGSNSHDPDADADTNANTGSIDSLSFIWTAPDGIELSATDIPQPTFTIPAGLIKDTLLAFDLLVIDEQGASSITDTVNITVENTNPIAVVGNNVSILLGESYTFDSSLSTDLNNDSLNYHWNITQAPENSIVTFDDASSIKPNLTPDKEGDYSIELTVDDNQGGTSSSELILSASKIPVPTANAGFDQFVEVGTDVTLDSSASRAKNGNSSLNYLWSSPTNISLDGIGFDRPSFTVPEGYTKDQKLSFTLVVTDTDNVNSAADSVDIYIVNTPPTVSAISNQRGINIGETVSLDASGSSDVNNDDLIFSWTIENTPSENVTTIINPNNEKSTFTPLIAGLYSLKVSVDDQNGGISAATVDINVSQTNQKPIADAGLDQSGTVNSTITLDGNISSDPDEADTLTFLWTAPIGIELSANNIKQPSFTLPEGLKHNSDLVFSLVVTDNKGSSSSEDLVKISVLNSDPIADAGQNQVSKVVNDNIILNASNSSDPNEDTLIYEWTPPAGIKLSSSTIAQPTFTLPVGTKAGFLQFDLTVKDIHGGMDTSMVLLSILNSQPVAEAGQDQTISLGEIANFDGSASKDDNNDSLKYSWSILKGPSDNTATLVNPNTNKPSFTPTVAGTYTINLSVDDDKGGVASSTLTLAVIQDNQPPIADAGADQSGDVNTKITLDASKSNDPDSNDTLEYVWKGPDNAPLSAYDVKSPTLTIPTGLAKNEKIIFDLFVIDSKGSESNTDSVSIIVNNSLPNANPGNNQINKKVNDTINLNGNASSDPNGDALTYEWSSPDGIEIVIDADDKAQASLIIPTGYKEGDLLKIDLLVKDIHNASDSKTLSVAIVNSLPIANAGMDQNALVGETVTLDGRESFDPNDDVFTYDWIPPPGFSTFDRTASQPTFTVANGVKAGTSYEFGLIVKDNFGTSTTSKTVVTILNSAPTADAGIYQTILPGATAQLAGSGLDANNDNLDFTWSVSIAPSGSAATITNPNSPNATFKPDVLGNYTLELLVSDNTDSAISSVQLNSSEQIIAMVIVPGGEFQMGDERLLNPATQGYDRSFEVPVHTVNISKFAIGKYEVTFNEYDQYLQSIGIDTNNITDPTAEAYDLGWGRGTRPVISLNRDDVQAYIDWLNELEGIASNDPKRYRLPTEAEWEYAARARTTTAFNTGICINSDQANFVGDAYKYLINDRTELISCPASTRRTQTVEVDDTSFKPNAFGLFHMSGNVWEFVEDCWHNDYINAPTDGSAWLEEDSGRCSTRVLRGGTWGGAGPMNTLRSAYRAPHFGGTSRKSTYGFRLAKTL